MRNAVFLLLVTIAGCATTTMMDDSTKTAVDREDDLQKNLREGRSWKEQEEMMKDLRGTFQSQFPDR